MNEWILMHRGLSISGIIDPEVPDYPETMYNAGESHTLQGKVTPVQTAPNSSMKCKY